jgi:SAM-dependent methyltransferase
LPFPDTIADVIVAENLIEHVRDQKKLFAEFARVRKSGSRLMARTVNRFAFGPEPHVGVWGVGYLPRALMQPYVRLVRKLSYEHVHLQSASDLRLSIQGSGDLCLVVRAARLSQQDYQHQRPIRRFLFAQVGAVLRRGDWLANLVGTVGPYLDVVSEAKNTIQPRRQHANVVGELAPTTMP